MRRRDFIALIGGGAAAGPLAAYAQQPTLPVIGFLSSLSPEAVASWLAAFRAGLKVNGFIEGHNAVIEFRWVQGRYDRR